MVDDRIRELALRIRALNASGREFRCGGKVFGEGGDVKPVKRSFDDWAKQISAYKGIDVLGDDTYDYKGFYNADPAAAYSMLLGSPDVHFTDKYKKPNHPTFSDESIYHSDKTPGGHWVQDGSGRWVFQHSAYTAQHADATDEYLRKNDPGSYAVFDQGELAPAVAEVSPDFWMDKEFMRRQMFMENDFLPSGESDAGAQGYWQIIPEMAELDYMRAHGLKEHGDLNDFEYATKVRNWYMEQLANKEYIKKDNQSPEVWAAKTAAAYNWGGNNLKGFLEKLKSEGYDIYNSMKWVDRLPLEVRNYVRVVVQNKNPIGLRALIRKNKARYKRVRDKRSPMAYGGFLRSFADGGGIGPVFDGIDYEADPYMFGAFDPMFDADTDVESMASMYASPEAIGSSSSSKKEEPSIFPSMMEYKNGEFDEMMKKYGKQYDMFKDVITNYSKNNFAGDKFLINNMLYSVALDPVHTIGYLDKEIQKHIAAYQKKAAKATDAKAKKEALDHVATYKRIYNNIFTNAKLDHNSLVELALMVNSPDKYAGYSSNSKKKIESTGKAMYDYLQSKGLSRAQTMAILANSMAETMGWTKLKQMGGGPGKGYFMFEEAEQANYADWCKKNGRKDSMESQVDYVLERMNSRELHTAYENLANYPKQRALIDNAKSIKDLENASGGTKAGYHSRNYTSKQLMEDWNSDDPYKAMRAFLYLYERPGVPREDARTAGLFLLNNYFKACGGKLFDEGGNVTTPKVKPIDQKYIGEDGMMIPKEQYYQMQAEAARLLAKQNSDARKFAEVPQIGTDDNGNPIYGASCLYTATDNYNPWNMVAGNYTLMENPGKYGFIKIPYEDALPGDIAQIQGWNPQGYWHPSHAMIYDGNATGDDRFTYSWGSKVPKDPTAMRHSWRVPLSDNSRMQYYRFVGNDQDKANWDKDYYMLMNQFVASQPMPILPTGTVTSNDQPKLAGFNDRACGGGVRRYAAGGPAVLNEIAAQLAALQHTSPEYYQQNQDAEVLERLLRNPELAQMLGLMKYIK